MATPSQNPAVPDTVRDVVCGMEVPANSKHHRLYKGVDYRFCCGYCLAKFLAEPERFVRSA